MNLFKSAAICAMWTALLSSEPAQAGFLDFFLGPAPRTETPYVSTPLEMTIRPQKERRPKAIKTNVEAPPPVLVTPMDPVKDPNWFLHDPTLRKGDVIVLPAGKVVVFNGYRGDRKRSDFEDLLRTHLVSLKERSRIKALTEYIFGRAIGSSSRVTAALPKTHQQDARAPQGGVRMVSMQSN